MQTSTIKSVLLYSGIAFAAMAAGIFVSQWLDKDDDIASQQLAAISKIGVPEYRPGFSLKDINGSQRNLDKWNDKIILLNFWATWCPPCRKEMPDFVELREQLAGHPFEVIGVAIDRVEPVKKFMNEIGVNYPILLAELEGLKIMQAYGNQLTTLPYTVIIDRQQKIVKTFRTEVTKEEILAIVQPLLSK